MCVLLEDLRTPLTTDTQHCMCVGVLLVCYSTLYVGWCAVAAAPAWVPVKQEASVRGQLYMDTFQRLNIGLMVQSLISLVVLAQAVSLRNAVLTGGVMAESIGCLLY